jgi:hypothetical protein
MNEGTLTVWANYCTRRLPIKFLARSSKYIGSWDLVISSRSTRMECRSLSSKLASESSEKFQLSCISADAGLGPFGRT